MNKNNVKAAFKQLGKSVCVLTSKDSEQRMASVATAVCNISDQAATLLVCIEKNASFAAVLQQGQRFAINLLAADQQAIMNQCVQFKGEQRFANGNWREQLGCEILDDATAHFICKVRTTQEVDTHNIIIADIEEANSNERCEGLIYMGGKFHPISDT